MACNINEIKHWMLKPIYKLKINFALTFIDDAALIACASGHD